MPGIIFITGPNGQLIPYPIDAMPGMNGNPAGGFSFGPDGSLGVTQVSQDNPHGGATQFETASPTPAPRQRPGADGIRPPGYSGGGGGGGVGFQTPGPVSVVDPLPIGPPPVFDPRGEARGVTQSPSLGASLMTAPMAGDVYDQHPRGTGNDPPPRPPQASVGLPPPVTPWVPPTPTPRTAPGTNPYPAPEGAQFYHGTGTGAWNPNTASTYGGPTPQNPSYIQHGTPTAASEPNMDLMNQILQGLQSGGLGQGMGKSGMGAMNPYMMNPYMGMMNPYLGMGMPGMFGGMNSGYMPMGGMPQMGKGGSGYPFTDASAGSAQPSGQTIIGWTPAGTPIFDTSQSATGRYMPMEMGPYWDTPYYASGGGPRMASGSAGRAEGQAGTANLIFPGGARGAIGKGGSPGRPIPETTKPSTA